MAENRSFKADRERDGRRGENAKGLLERQMPQALDAERGVLGSLLLLPEKFDEVALVLRPDDFYDDANSRIYAHLIEMHDDGKQIDPMLLVQHLRDGGDYDMVGGAAYIAELGEAVPTAAHAEYYAKIVHEKATLRSLIHASTDIIRDSYDPTIQPREMLSRAEERVFSILEEKGSNQVTSIREVLHESLARIDARMKNDHASGGVETRLRRLRRDDRRTARQ